MKKLLIIYLILFFGSCGNSQSDTTPDIEEIFVNPEFYPTYPGGEFKLYEFLDSNLVYPKSEELYGKFGTVYVEFFVEKDGNLSNFNVKLSPHELLSIEVLRVCKLMPKWNPGGHHLEKTVYLKTRMVLPIRFTKEKMDLVNKRKVITLHEPISPSFPDGEEKMKSFIQLVQHYPDSAKKNKIEGKVYIQFNVSKNGELSNFKPFRSPDSLLNQEAIHVLKLMPKWNPGMNYYRDTADVRMVIPFNFTINNDPVFQVVETQPSFPGGDAKLFEFLGKSIKYPELDHQNGIRSKFYFEFIIEKDGSLSNLNLLKNDSPEFYKSIALAFNDMPKWNPGLQNGKPVRTKMVIPFNVLLR